MSGKGGLIGAAVGGGGGGDRQYKSFGDPDAPAKGLCSAPCSAVHRPVLRAVGAVSARGQRRCTGLAMGAVHGVRRNMCGLTGLTHEEKLQRGRALLAAHRARGRLLVVRPRHARLFWCGDAVCRD
jgi:hypothetical protein